MKAFEKNRSPRTDQDIKFDSEISRKAQEDYRAFALKLAKANEESNISLNYPIHWQFSSPAVRSANEESAA